MPLALSPVEAVALHVAQCACRRITLRFTLGVALIVAAYWLYVRLLGSIDPAETTLYNPDRLHEAIASFTLPPPAQTPGHHGDRLGARHRTEAIFRRLLERMLGMELPKVRPKWLVNRS